MLGGMDVPTEGKVIVDGKEISSYNDKQLSEYRADMIGFIFQFYNLLPGLTAYENVALVKDINRSALSPDEMLERVGLADQKNKFPTQMSGGQQQRVSIARALAKQPEILFFDEPTSALDPELTAEVLKVIRQLAAEHMTMIIVTHEMQFAKEVSDRIIFMEEGIIKAQGTPDELFANSNARVMEFIGRLQK